MKRLTKALNSWISAAGREHLAKAVEKAEQTTAAEIVVIVSGRASTVEHVPALIFALVALLTATAALAHAHIHLSLDLLLFLGLGLVAALLAALLGGRYPLVQRFFTTPSDREKQVADRAELEFYRRGLTGTRERTGVLVFVALMEHRVHILADEAIASRAGEETWRHGVTTILEGIRAGDLVTGLERALAIMTPVLQELAPADPDNPNELADHVILLPY